MDFVVLFALSAILCCTLGFADVQSHGAASQLTAGLRISKGAGPITVEDAPDGAVLDTGAGRIHVKSAGRCVGANTGAGHIMIDSINGCVRAATGLGTVSVTMVGNPADGERDVKIIGSMGDVTLVVPDGLDMDFDLQLAYTDNAKKEFRIVSDFPMNQRVTDQWSSAEGTPRKYIYGTGQIGTGRNQIKIRNINGNIYLKRGQ